ncbi:MAG: hypothetical protein GWN87_25975 [Desulfuromonadales bacterium]|nr:hypothetical protein [Desulfuromonadales bacterium]NIS43214.1 hypothetical protein [Desulfuromonadales bacterium]
MPLEKREPLSVFQHGQTLEGVRLVFRVGRSHRLAQVIDFQGRQMVDETIYGGEQKDDMLKNAQQLLLKMAG